MKKSQKKSKNYINTNSIVNGSKDSWRSVWESMILEFNSHIGSLP